jgi:hypothetical protein
MTLALDLLRLLARFDSLFGPVSIVPLADGSFYAFGGIPPELADRPWRHA